MLNQLARDTYKREHKDNERAKEISSQLLSEK